MLTAYKGNDVSLRRVKGEKNGQFSLTSMSDIFFLYLS